MGTRSLTRFIEKYEDGTKEVVTMYKQYDGYPSGFGVELSEFLSKGKVVNGISSYDDVVFNGMGCLAAQVVSEFKSGPGGIYLEAPGTKDVGEEYVYEITLDSTTNELTIRCIEVWPGKTLFEGTPKDMLEFCAVSE